MTLCYHTFYFVILSDIKKRVSRSTTIGTYLLLCVTETSMSRVSPISGGGIREGQGYHFASVATDEQTNEQTNKWTPPLRKAFLRRELSQRSMIDKVYGVKGHVSFFFRKHLAPRLDERIDCRLMLISSIVHGKLSRQCRDVYANLYSPIAW